MEVVYYNALLAREIQQSFRNGFAIRVKRDDWDPYAYENESLPRLTFSINTYCAIILLKFFPVIWKDIPIEFFAIRPFDSYEDTTILPEGLADAAVKLKRFAETITGNEVGTDLKWSWTADKEFRIVLDMEELKQSLLNLADFLEESSQESGMAVEFWL